MEKSTHCRKNKQSTSFYLVFAGYSYFGAIKTKFKVYYPIASVMVSCFFLNKGKNVK